MKEFNYSSTKWHMWLWYVFSLHIKSNSNTCDDYFSSTYTNTTSTTYHLHPLEFHSCCCYFFSYLNECKATVMCQIWSLHVHLWTIVGRKWNRLILYLFIFKEKLMFFFLLFHYKDYQSCPIFMKIQIMVINMTSSKELVYSTMVVVYMM